MTDGTAETIKRIPAEMFHPSVFILEEIEARGWTLDDLAHRMGGDFGINRLALDFYINAGPEEPDLVIGDGEDFARAFGTSAELWRNLEAGWRVWKKAQALPSNVIKLGGVEVRAGEGVGE